MMAGRNSIGGDGAATTTGRGTLTIRLPIGGSGSSSSTPSTPSPQLGGWALNPHPPSSPPAWFRNDISSSSSSGFSEGSHTDRDQQSLQNLSDGIHKLIKDLSDLGTLAKKLGTKEDTSSLRRKVSCLRDKARLDIKRLSSSLVTLRSQVARQTETGRAAERLSSLLETCSNNYRKTCGAIDVAVRKYPAPLRPSSNTAGRPNAPLNDRYETYYTTEPQDPMAGLEQLRQTVLARPPTTTTFSSIDFETELVMEVEREMEKVTADVALMREAYTDVYKLVRQDGETIDNIEAEVSKARAHNEQGLENVVEASRVKKTGYIFKGVAGGAVIGGLALGGGMVPLGIGVGAVLSGAAAGGVIGGVCGGIGGKKLADSRQYDLDKVVMDEMLRKEMGNRWRELDEAEHCANCKSEFIRLIRKPHRCRACGNIFCASCSNYRRKVKVPGASSVKLEARVCAQCCILEDAGLTSDMLPNPMFKSTSTPTTTTTAATSSSRDLLSSEENIATDKENDASALSRFTNQLSMAHTWKRLEDGFRNLVDSKAS